MSDSPASSSSKKRPAPLPALPLRWRGASVPPAGPAEHADVASERLAKLPQHTGSVPERPKTAFSGNATDAATAAAIMAANAAALKSAQAKQPQSGSSSVGSRSGRKISARLAQSHPVSATALARAETAKRKNQTLTPSFAFWNDEDDTGEFSPEGTARRVQPSSAEALQERAPPGPPIEDDVTSSAEASLTVLDYRGAAGGLGSAAGIFPGSDGDLNANDEALQASNASSMRSQFKTAAGSDRCLDAAGLKGSGLDLSAGARPSHVLPMSPHGALGTASQRGRTAKISRTNVAELIASVSNEEAIRVMQATIKKAEEREKELALRTSTAEAGTSFPKPSHRMHHSLSSVNLAREHRKRRASDRSPQLSIDDRNSSPPENRRSKMNEAAVPCSNQSGSAACSLNDEATLRSRRTSNTSEKLSLPDASQAEFDADPVGAAGLSLVMLPSESTIRRSDRCKAYLEERYKYIDEAVRNPAQLLQERLFNPLRTLRFSNDAAMADLRRIALDKLRILSACRAGSDTSMEGGGGGAKDDEIANTRAIGASGGEKETRVDAGLSGSSTLHAQSTPEQQRRGRRQTKMSLWDVDNDAFLAEKMVLADLQADPGLYASVLDRQASTGSASGTGHRSRRSFGGDEKRRRTWHRVGFGLGLRKGGILGKHHRSKSLQSLVDGYGRSGVVAGSADDSAMSSFDKLESTLSGSGTGGGMPTTGSGLPASGVVREGRLPSVLSAPIALRAPLSSSSDGLSSPPFSPTSPSAVVPSGHLTSRPMVQLRLLAEQSLNKPFSPDQPAATPSTASSGSVGSLSPALQRLQQAVQLPADLLNAPISPPAVHSAPCPPPGAISGRNKRHSFSIGKFSGPARRGPGARHSRNVSVQEKPVTRQIEEGLLRPSALYAVANVDISRTPVLSLTESTPSASKAAMSKSRFSPGNRNDAAHHLAESSKIRRFRLGKRIRAKLRGDHPQNYDHDGHQCDTTTCHSSDNNDSDSSAGPLSPVAKAGMFPPSFDLGGAVGTGIDLGSFGSQLSVLQSSDDLGMGEFRSRAPGSMRRRATVPCSVLRPESSVLLTTDDRRAMERKYRRWSTAKIWDLEATRGSAPAKVFVRIPPVLPRVNCSRLPKEALAVMERYSRRRAAIIDVVTGNGTGQAEEFAGPSPRFVFNTLIVGSGGKLFDMSVSVSDVDDATRTSIPEGLSATGARLEKSIASAKEFLDSINGVAPRTLENADDLIRAASPLSSRTGQNRKPEAAGSLRASPDLEVFWDAVVQQEGKLARLRKANKNVTGKMEEALARLSEIGLEVEEDYLQRAKLVEDHLAHLRVERSRSISRDLFYTVMAYVLASVAFAFWFAVSVFNLGRRACAGLAEVPRRLKAYVVRSAPAGPSFLWTG